MKITRRGFFGSAIGAIVALTTKMVTSPSAKQIAPSSKQSADIDMEIAHTNFRRWYQLEVRATDPDRWIFELDQKIAKTVQS